MRSPTPLVPEHDVSVYIVLDDFGPLGRAYAETDEAKADERTVIEEIINGEHSFPRRVVAFNTHEGWARDVTEDIARKIMEQNAKGRELSAPAREFVERVTRRPILVTV